MSFDKILKNKHINILYTNIGDKFISKSMINKKISFGGENSGHYIFSDYSTSSDGILSLLSFLKIILEKKNKSNSIILKKDIYNTYSLNISIFKKLYFKQFVYTLSLFKYLTSLFIYGKVILRYSGTENKIRLYINSSKKIILFHYWIAYSIINDILLF